MGGRQNIGFAEGLTDSSPENSEDWQHLHSLYVNPNRRFDTLEDDGHDEWHEFTKNELACKNPPRVKVSFKPVDQGGNRGQGNGRGR